jgi:hypothetical protein
VEAEAEGSGEEADDNVRRPRKAGVLACHDALRTTS